MFNKDGQMGGNSELVQIGFLSRVNKIRGIGCLPLLPVGCVGAIVLAKSVMEMARVMDFTALQAYVNAFTTLFK